jgi:hypothetical protein
LKNGAVDSKYLLIDEIGSGGYGHVYKAV